jgi:hypothetical protein
MRDVLSKTLWGVLKDAFKEGERRRRSHARAIREEEKWGRATECTVKEAVFAVLKQAWAQATDNGRLPVSARMLYYAVRAAMQEYTGKPLDFNYFSQTLLTEWKEMQGPDALPGLYFDPRGFLYEPHQGKTVFLGTREVEAYDFPEYVFDKILYIEKKGLIPIFQSARLGERFDLAIVAGEGYATEAVRTLFERAEQGNYRLFVLHDADPHGYNIARTLAEETRRMPDYSVEVTDLGLHLEEALRLGLQTEKFIRKNALPYNLELNETERKYFEGKFYSHKKYECERIELNAFTAPGLIAFVERKLHETGADDKLIPPAKHLKQHSGEVFATKFRKWIEDEAFAALGLEDIIAALQKRFAKPALKNITTDQLTKILEQHREIAWREAVDGEIKRALETGHGKMLAALVEELREAVETFLDESP